MNERKLKIFYEVATKLNMTKVAEEMSISQPSVSQAIKEIEEEMKCAFFERIGKKIHLSYEGKIFLNYTRRILNLMDESKERINNFNNLQEGNLNIGASSTIGVYMLPNIMKKFGDDHPNINVSISIKNTEDIINALLVNELDFALVEGIPNNEELTVRSFYKDELVFISSKYHDWSKKKFLEIKDVEKERFIMMEHGTGTRDIVENIFSKNNIRCASIFEIGYSEAIKNMVLNGLGVSCISKLCMENSYKKDFSIKTITDLNFYRFFYLVYHKDKFLNKQIKCFLDYII